MGRFLLQFMQQIATVSDELRIGGPPNRHNAGQETDSKSGVPILTRLGGHVEQRRLFYRSPYFRRRSASTDSGLKSRPYPTRY